MPAYTIRQSGGDFNSIDGFIDDAGTVAADVGNIEGAWSIDDAAQVTWSKAVTVKANDSSSKQIGRPWESGDTSYRHKVTTGHAFIVTANVDVQDFNIQSASGMVSAEIFAVEGIIANFEAKRMMLGFVTEVDQQDVLYFSSGKYASIATFEQCFFYGVARTIVDDWQSSSDHTVNFNSCVSHRIGTFSARNNGAWYGSASGSGTVVVNAHNCLMDVNSLWVIAYLAGQNSTTNAENNITNVDVGSLSFNGDVENVSNNNSYNHSFVDSDSGEGNFVVLRNLTANPYDPRLHLPALGNAKNQAQEQHSTRTGLDSGLVIPNTDIVGTPRPSDTNFSIGLFEYPGAGPAPGAMPVIMQKYRHLLNGGR